MLKAAFTLAKAAQRGKANGRASIAPPALRRPQSPGAKTVKALTLFAGLTLIVTILCRAQDEDQMVALSGTVTGFSGHPLEGADILVRDDNFHPLCQTKTDVQGRYAIAVEPGTDPPSSPSCLSPQ
jgi:hypothetical protein